MPIEEQYIKKLAGVDSNIYTAMDKLNRLSAEEGHMAMAMSLSLSNEILERLDIAIRCACMHFTPIPFPTAHHDVS